MMSNTFKIIFLFLFGLTNVSFHNYDENSYNNTEEIAEKMFSAMENVRTIRYKLQLTERIRGKLEARESEIKLQVSPRKLYMKIKNQELLWIQGANGGNALVNPGTFPYVNLNLDPLGSIMRKDQHHTIHELGFAYFASILKNHRDKYLSDFKKHFFITGEEVFDGKNCYKLTVMMPNFKWESYTVKKGENIVTIARRNYISQYMILENNKNVSWYDAVKEGQQIQIPNSYCKYALILIDKESFLPISIRIIDDRGLFESYQYLDIKLNIPIASDEFTRGYKDYKF
jgi:hypothetical protein